MGGLTGAQGSVTQFLFITYSEGNQGPLELVGASVLSVLDFRAASQTPLSDLCIDGNKNFFELRSDCGVHRKVL